MSSRAPGRGQGQCRADVQKRASVPTSCATSLGQGASQAQNVSLEVTAPVASALPGGARSRAHSWTGGVAHCDGQRAPPGALSFLPLAPARGRARWEGGLERAPDSASRRWTAMLTAYRALACLMQHDGSAACTRLCHATSICTITARARGAPELAHPLSSEMQKREREALMVLARLASGASCPLDHPPCMRAAVPFLKTIAV